MSETTNLQQETNEMDVDVEKIEELRAGLETIERGFMNAGDVRTLLALLPPKPEPEVPPGPWAYVAGTDKWVLLDRSLQRFCIVDFTGFGFSLEQKDAILQRMVSAPRLQSRLDAAEGLLQRARKDATKSYSNRAEKLAYAIDRYFEEPNRDGR